MPPQMSSHQAFRLELRDAREYLRVSKDRSGEQRSPDEQHRDNAGAAESHGLALGTPYRETTAVSASRYSKKTRGAFERLLKDLASGEFCAKVLVLWESSRGSRKVSEWVALIEALEAAGVTVFVTTHGREYDPANARDRRSLLEDAVDSEYETAKSSGRIRRDLARCAQDGKPHGAIPYGYRRERDPRNGKLLRQVPDESESPVVAESFARLDSGESLRGICRDFTARSIFTRTGKPWTESRLRQMVLSGAHAGLRIHDPDWNGKRLRYAGAPGVQVTVADWEPIVDADVFWRVYKRLTASDRTTTRPGRAKHLLSLIAVCDPCGSPLTAKKRDGAPYYYCQAKGCVRVSEPDLDDYAETAMIDYMARPENFEAWDQDEQNRELALLRAKMTELRVRLDQIADAVADGSLSPATAGKAEQKINDDIRAYEAREREMITPEALSGLIEPGADVADVAQGWEQALLPARREIARMLLAPGKMGQLRVTRNPTGKMRAPVNDRVRLVTA